MAAKGRCLNVTLEPDVAKEAHTEAQRQGRSLASLMREAWLLSRDTMRTLPKRVDAAFLELPAANDQADQWKDGERQWAEARNVQSRRPEVAGRYDARRISNGAKR